MCHFKCITYTSVDLLIKSRTIQTTFPRVLVKMEWLQHQFLDKTESLHSIHKLQLPLSHEKLSKTVGTYQYRFSKDPPKLFSHSRQFPRKRQQTHRPFAKIPKKVISCKTVIKIEFNKLKFVPVDHGKIAFEYIWLFLQIHSFLGRAPVKFAAGTINSHSGQQCWPLKPLISQETS